MGWNFIKKIFFIRVTWLNSVQLSYLISDLYGIQVNNSFVEFLKRNCRSHRRAIFRDYLREILDFGSCERVPRSCLPIFIKLWGTVYFDDFFTFLKLENMTSKPVLKVRETAFIKKFINNLFHWKIFKSICGCAFILSFFKND